MVEAHYKACMFAGVKIAGTNAEVMPAQVTTYAGQVMNLHVILIWPGLKFLLLNKIFYS